MDAISSILMESQWFAYINRGEQLQVPTLLNAINEGGHCLLSGETQSELTNASGENAGIDLVDYPIDFDINNILPSNMATVNKTSIRHPIKTFGYTISLGQLTIDMASDENLYGYNTELISKFQPWDEVVDHTNIVGAWDFLIRNHVKGIVKISSNNCFLTTFDALGYFKRKIHSINAEPNLGLV